MVLPLLLPSSAFVPLGPEFQAHGNRLSAAWLERQMVLASLFGFSLSVFISVWSTEIASALLRAIMLYWAVLQMWVPTAAVIVRLASLAGLFGLMSLVSLVEFLPFLLHQFVRPLPEVQELPSFLSPPQIPVLLAFGLVLRPVFDFALVFSSIWYYQALLKCVQFPEVNSLVLISGFDGSPLPVESSPSSQQASRENLFRTTSPTPATAEPSMALHAQLREEAFVGRLHTLAGAEDALSLYADDVASLDGEVAPSSSAN